eukprot:TRINITY_DN46240_c0_g1_i1.p1 TRINITY_DN46240_c0_g1~~TRINITY_DN46240_c0_g1_i1.p1  ORF type:complete len:380 (-),score=21.96 TRINITY_DN46240_c0_g1_i1:87-1226(-)
MFPHAVSWPATPSSGYVPVVPTSIATAYPSATPQACHSAVPVSLGPQALGPRIGQPAGPARLFSWTAPPLSPREQNSAVEVAVENVVQAEFIAHEEDRLSHNENVIQAHEHAQEEDRLSQDEGVLRSRLARYDEQQLYQNDGARQAHLDYHQVQRLNQNSQLAHVNSSNSLHHNSDRFERAAQDRYYNESRFFGSPLLPDQRNLLPHSSSTASSVGHTSGARTSPRTQSPTRGRPRATSPRCKMDELLYGQFSLTRYPQASNRSPRLDVAPKSLNPALSRSPSRSRLSPVPSPRPGHRPALNASNDCVLLLRHMQSDESCAHRIDQLQNEFRLWNPTEYRSLREDVRSSSYRDAVKSPTAMARKVRAQRRPPFEISLRS